MSQDAAKHFELVVQRYTKLFDEEHPEIFDASNHVKQRQ